jgi:hypothetical protein
MIDIEKMSNHEWVDYRENQREAFFRAGNVLTPNINCSTCDISEEYVCFTCELSQLENKGF